MAQTIVGLYPDLHEVERLIDDLESHGIARSDISVIANHARGMYAKAGNSGDYTSSWNSIGHRDTMDVAGIGQVYASGPLSRILHGTGIVQSLTQVGIPEEAANLYAEGLREGGILTTVHTDDDLAGDVVDIMNHHNPIDLRTRADEWRGRGWERFDESQALNTEATYDTMHESGDLDTGAMYGGKRVYDKTARESHGIAGTGHDVDRDIRVPVTEEKLQVGKREVEGGSVRVEKTVSEKPVDETISLRKEHVDVERHPIDKPISAADGDAFKEGTIEVTATSEEPVVHKEARIVEEVVVHKDVEQQQKKVHDTVRRTDVHVEGSGNRDLIGGEFDNYASDFRRHYDKTYGTVGGGYDRYQPAYRYGYDLGTNQDYAGRTWNDVEKGARTDWEKNHPDTMWDKVKDAIRHGYEAVCKDCVPQH